MVFDSVTGGLAGIFRAQRSGTRLQAEVAQLFEDARDDVYRYLLTFGLYPAEAQEAAQEVFLRLYVTRKRNVNIQNPRAWIFRVAHNLGLRLRAKREASCGFDPNIEGRLVDPETNPEQSLLERERLARFHRAVENLSEQQQRCLLLRMEGLRYPEIGAVLGISPSAVGEFLRRAIARLRRLTHE